VNKALALVIVPSCWGSIASGEGMGKWVLAPICPAGGTVLDLPQRGWRKGTGKAVYAQVGRQQVE